MKAFALTIRISFDMGTLTKAQKELIKTHKEFIKKAKKLAKTKTFKQLLINLGKAVNDQHKRKKRGMKW